MQIGTLRRWPVVSLLCGAGRAGQRTVAGSGRRSWPRRVPRCAGTRSARQPRRLRVVGWAGVIGPAWLGRKPGPSVLSAKRLRWAQLRSFSCWGGRRLRHPFPLTGPLLPGLGVEGLGIGRVRARAWGLEVRIFHSVSVGPAGAAVGRPRPLHSTTRLKQGSVAPLRPSTGNKAMRLPCAVGGSLKKNLNWSCCFGQRGWLSFEERNGILEVHLQ